MKLLSRGIGLLCVLMLGVSAVSAQRLGEGSELEFGGPGGGEGTFGQVRDLKIGPNNDVYVLDGGEHRDGKTTGNFLVQIFNQEGEFLRQFSVRDESLGDRNNPARMAVDSKGRVYISEPAAGLVRQFDGQGKHLADMEVPRAFALAVREADSTEQLLVASNPPREPVEEIRVFDLSQNNREVASLRLPQPLLVIGAMTVDPQGRILMQAETWQLYRFDPSSGMMDTIGGGTRSRTQDGSELLHTVAVDSKGNIYSLTSGNPGLVTRFDSELTTVSRRAAQFSWFDPWGPHSHYTVLAIDNNDRMWVATTGRTERGVRHHYQPAIIRTRPDYFEVNTRHNSTAMLALRPSIEVPLPHHIGYALEPVSPELVIAPAHRRIDSVRVEWRVHDVYKQTVGEGTFDLPLVDGEEARQAFTFTPPQWGWYTIETQLHHEDKRLTGLGVHVAFTQTYDDVYTLNESDPAGGWNNLPRTAFAGFGMHRVSTKNLDEVEAAMTAAEDHGIVLLAQFESRAEAEPQAVREAVTRFKGRVKYWEVINEPDLSMSPDEYVKRLEAAVKVVREIDPDALIMGPSSCGIKIGWIERFYELGGGKMVDIISVHDYEGHESIDPVHWQWKLPALREVMTRHGDGDKPIWQTERGIPGVRADIFLGGAQAVRVLLQRDLLEAEGIPNEHNFYYYLNQGGYGAYPGYIWSNVGPHPAVPALRTRQAMIAGKRFTGRVDMGATGNRFLLGLRYQDDTGTMVSLRNFGMAAQPVEVRVSGGDALEVVDSFGNSTQVAVADGRALVDVPALPVYLRPANGQEIEIVPIDLGRDLAESATLSYSGETDRDPASLVDGIMSSTHHGTPHGGPDNSRGWVGKFETTPQSMELRWDQPQMIQDVLVFGQRADNAFSAVLDADVEYFDGQNWVTAAEIRTHCPQSDPVETPQARANTWYMDDNMLRATFEQPVQTDRIRLVVHRITQGLVPDDAAATFAESRPGGTQLQLRGISVYGPNQP